MDVQKVRKIRLRLLYDELGGVAAVAKKAGTAESYLSQITSEKGNRNLGNRLARKIEISCNKPVGWLDGLEVPDDTNSNVTFLPDYWKNVRSMVTSGDRSRRTPIYRARQLTDETLTIPSWALDSMGDSERNLFIVTIEDKSMMPLLREGDTVVCDANICTLEQVKPGRLYAVQYTTGPKIRLIDEQMNGDYLVAAMRGDRSHEMAKAEDIKIIGEAIWRGGRI